jgi:hypothetical protein
MGLANAVSRARCDPRTFYMGALKARLPRLTEIYAGRPGYEPENYFLEFFRAAIEVEESRRGKPLPLKWLKNMARMSSVLIRCDWLARKYGPSAVEEARRLLFELYSNKSLRFSRPRAMR